ncbi:hypothetical protein NDN08_004084 [Rhodosorus marinus]|uniref:Vacuolar ATPase assembly protein VMA22 n=1 Tax=Rhodosorus marinus TaxID=101924 RepID=A0AAV8UHA4_9RHOD|nr:hypothetical protein NDN08_004084 [Rhodosorus marinus]
MSTQNEKIVEVLDLVDEIVQLKQALSTSMSRGFMDIAEERYYKRSALLELSKFMYDERPEQARVVVTDKLELEYDDDDADSSANVQDRISSPVGVLVSPSLRDAGIAFRNSLEISLELVKKDRELTMKIEKYKLNRSS